MANSEELGLLPLENKTQSTPVPSGKLRHVSEATMLLHPSALGPQENQPENKQNLNKLFRTSYNDGV